MLSAITLHTTAAPAWSDMKRIERQIVAPVFPDAEFSVGDFGAAGNGVNDDRPAIQAAIDCCSNQGGGRVVLAAGRNVELLIKQAMRHRPALAGVEGHQACCRHAPPLTSTARAAPKSPRTAGWLRPA